MYFDSTNNVTKVYNGTDWQAASSSIEGIKSDFQYTATASQTVFSGNDDNTNELVIDKAGLTNVFLNGVRLVDSDYTVDVGANSVTLASGASVNDIVEIEVFGNFAGQSGADVAITGGSITGLTELSTGTFTSTGIDDNATSTAITIDASENVGIGTASPDRPVHLSSAGTRNYFKAETTGATNASESGFEIKTPNSNWLINSLGGDNALTFYDLGNTQERARIDSSGNLLVGTTDTSLFNTSTSTGHNLYTNGAVAHAASSTASGIFNRLSSDGDIVDFRKDGSTVGSIGVYGGLYPYLTGPNFGVVLGSSDFVPSTTTGFANDNTIDLGSSSRRFKDLYLSGGVYLGGTGAANKLDDYEEGTWTPTLSSGTSAVSQGSYVKIGGLVTITGIIGSFSDQSSSGAILINNLPFACKSGDRYQAHGECMHQHIGGLNDGAMSAYINDNTSVVEFFGLRTGDSWLNIRHSDIVNSSGYLRFTMSYRTDS
jgi:hypothetical protein